MLPERDSGPRDAFDRVRAFIAAGEIDPARDLARELVNRQDAGTWGDRAVGEVFLALGKPDRAGERFRSADDLLGRARVKLALSDPAVALEWLEPEPADDPDAGAVRLAAMRALGQPTVELESTLRERFDEERSELLEALEGSGPFVLANASGGAAPDADALRGALRELFGYDEFRPGQLDMILPLLSGTSVLGLMPTGAGKSICFQLPSAFLPGATVVISPLIALMKDQVEGLPARLYRRATLINSSLEPGEAERRMGGVARGEVSLIYAAPERLRQRAFVHALQRRGVSLFVIDEAHCVSLWGHDFRPDYFFIRRVLEDLGKPTVLALTATATPEMQKDIGKQLDVPLRTVNLGTYRPNLRLEARKLGGDAEKWGALAALAREETGPAIVYVDRRRLAEELAGKLRAEGIAAEGYHAGMDKAARDRVQTRFMLGELRVITATVAFGMGVDKADVRLVAHYNLPRSLEAYYQEAGRAGRDGLPARCVLLYSSQDKSNLTRRANQDRLQPPEILSLHRILTQRLNGAGAAPTGEQLERDTGLDGTRLRVAISLLQGIGALERSYDLPGSVWIAPQPSASRADFMAFAAALGLNGRASAFPAAQVAAAAGVAPDELETRLLDWEDAGLLRYRASGRGMGLTIRHAGADLERRIAQALEIGTQTDARRLTLLARYLDTRECRPGFVSRYFGGPPQKCGECDNCRTAAGPRGARPRIVVELSDEESALFERLRAWRREKAKEEGVPPFVIFHDRVLHSIAHQRPRTLAALAAVAGVGRAKIQAFGEEVLSITSADRPG